MLSLLFCLNPPRFWKKETQPLNPADTESDAESDAGADPRFFAESASDFFAESDAGSGAEPDAELDI